MSTGWDKMSPDEILRKIQEDFSKDYEAEFKRTFYYGGDGPKSSFKMEDFEASFNTHFDPDPVSETRKSFTAKHHSIGKQAYFHDWCATRLGVTREIAKSLTHRRLYGAAPSEIALVLAKHSTILEVRSTCETYLNDHNISRGPR